MMERSYRNLLSGKEKSAALREAKRWLMKSGGVDGGPRGLFLRKEGAAKTTPKTEDAGEDDAVLKRVLPASVHTGRTGLIKPHNQYRASWGMVWDR